MTIIAALRNAVDTLQNAGIPDPHTDAGLLLSHVTGFPRMALPLHGNQSLSNEQVQQLSSLLLSRASRKPLQYLLGEAHFFGRSFMVNERVLIPRPETEALCELAIRFLRQSVNLFPAPQVLDLCTGSGAIAVTLAREHPASQVTATDISEAALAVAQANAGRHQVQVRFLEGDLFSPVQGMRFHCIACNPPYVESAACSTLQEEVLREPLLALDGGSDGLDFYRRTADEAADFLYPGGLLCMEIGDTQADAVCALFSREKRYMDISVHPDLSGTPRVVCAYAFSPT